MRSWYDVCRVIRLALLDFVICGNHGEAEADAMCVGRSTSRSCEHWQGMMQFYATLVRRNGTAQDTAERDVYEQG